MSQHEPFTLPGAYVRELIALSERFGVLPEQLLEGSGLTVAALENPALRLPMRSIDPLARRALQLTGEPGLPFYMGLQMRLSQHGFLGFAAMTAANLRSALQLAERFGRTRTAAVSLRLDEEGGLASLTLEEHAELGEMREFLVVALFTGLVQLAHAATRKKLTGAVDFTFAEQPYFQRFAHLVPGEMRFVRASNRLIFAAELLDTPILSADPVAMQLAREQCERELASLGEGVKLIDQVRARLHEAGRVVPTIDEVARQLHVSTRTLKRKLTEHGTSFTQIVDGHLRRQALLLLEDPRLTIDEVADRLGYSDAANFTRAFKRWTGMAPGAFRAQ